MSIRPKRSEGRIRRKREAIAAVASNASRARVRGVALNKSERRGREWFVVTKALLSSSYYHHSKELK